MPSRLSRLWVRLPWWVLPLGIFVATRIVDALILYLASRDQTALTKGGIDARVVDAPPHPSYPTVATNWDGQWYWQVARGGYPDHLPEVHGQVQRNAWAFYPLYPALARLLMLTGMPFDVAGPLVSTLCAAAGVCVLFAVVARHGGRFAAGVTVLALCLYPAAPVLQVAYTEGLALLLVAVAVDALDRRRYGVFVLACVLLGLTRPISAALALLAALVWLARWRRRGTVPFERRERFTLGGAALAAGAAFFVWPVVTGVVVGRWDGYLATQKAWVPSNNGFGTWGLVLLGHGSPAQVVGVWVVAVLVAAALLQPGARAWGTPLRLWAVAYGLFLLATIRPAPSTIRYPLPMLVPFWPFPGLTAASRPAWLRWAVVALVVVVGLALQWFWVDRYYVPAPDRLGYP